ncbi:MAG: hypothetical protein Q7U04_01550 [Bacteriovorax sp.]|nr:hypothetical protein [Bacteriovorax sp.]
MAEKNYFRNKFSSEFYREFQKARFRSLFLSKDTAFSFLLLFVGLFIWYVIFNFLINRRPFGVMPSFRRMALMIFLSSRAFEEGLTDGMVNIASLHCDCSGEAIVLSKEYWAPFSKFSKFREVDQKFLDELRLWAKEEKVFPFGKFCLVDDKIALSVNKDFYKE